MTSIGESPSNNDMKITWYQSCNPISDELQRRMGIQTSVQDGLCVLHIDSASKRFAGVYKCEAKNSLGVCETSCRLLIDRK